MLKTDSQKMYDGLASGYRGYSRGRINYLNAIDSVVKDYIKPNVSIIDFGAADGVRIHNIICGVSVSLCLVENSHNMLQQIFSMWPNASVLACDFAGSDFQMQKKYDVATCLWNVLGHLGDEPQVLNGLQNIKKSVKKDGIVILDVNNRHNLAQYGWQAFKNMIKDTFFYSFNNGDIKFNINLERGTVPSSVHIFSRPEIERLIKQAGFVIKHRLFINYANGKQQKSSLFGQLCYILTVKK